MRVPGVVILLVVYATAFIVAVAFMALVPGLGMNSWLGPLVALAMILIAGGLGLKWAIVAASSAMYEPVPSSPDAYPGIDRASLDAQSDQLAKLGFETIVDYGLKQAPPASIGGFARLFQNPSTSVYAEANQVLRNGVPAVSMAVSFISLFEGDWSMTTTTRRPTKSTAVQYALRRPQRRCQIVVGTSLDVAYQRHLDATARYAEQHALATPSGDPADVYLQYLERQRDERRAAAKRLNVVKFLYDMRSYSRSPKLEW